MTSRVIWLSLSVSCGMIVGSEKWPRKCEESAYVRFGHPFNSSSDILGPSRLSYMSNSSNSSKPANTFGERGEEISFCLRHSRLRDLLNLSNRSGGSELDINRRCWSWRSFPPLVRRHHHSEEGRRSTPLFLLGNLSGSQLPLVVHLRLR